MATQQRVAIKSSAGVPADIPEGNIARLFLEAVDSHDKPDALMYRRDGAWRAISHRQVYEDVKRAALGFQALGIARGDRVAILSENCPEWLLSDFACVISGAISVPLYPVLPADQLAYMLRDSEAKAVVVSGEHQLAKIRELRECLPALEHVIAFDHLPESGSGAFGFRELLELGDAKSADIDDEECRARALAVDPDDILTILYTSGTTGQPKGVMLTHRNLLSNVRAALQVLKIVPDDVSLSALPLSHIFERMAGHYVMIAAGATISYAESFAKLRENLRDVRPTVMTLVPRVYDRLAAQVRQSAKAGGPTKERVLNWALAVGGKRVDRMLEGRWVGPGLALQYRLADRLVFSKLRQIFGGRIRLLVSGGAPLNPETGRLFLATGVTLLEGYGLTETSPVIALNNFGDIKLGTVGRPLPGVEVGIAEDGEILTRGPHVMKGYFKMPDATATVITPDGWFHTGDIGELDEDGRLSITDRKKDLIVTAAGKNIAPQPIENRINGNPFVNQVVMIGDRRKFPVLLVVPDFDALENWARSQRIEFASREELVENGRVARFVEREVLGSLSGLARFECPRKMALLPRELSMKSGEITPTLKVKRRVVESNYKDIIDRLYLSQ